MPGLTSASRDVSLSQVCEIKKRGDEGRKGAIGRQKKDKQLASI